MTHNNMYIDAECPKSVEQTPYTDFVPSFQRDTHCYTDDRIASYGTGSVFGSGSIIIYQKGCNLRDRGKGDICHAVHFFNVNNGLGCLTMKRKKWFSVNI